MKKSFRSVSAVPMLLCFLLIIGSVPARGENVTDKISLSTIIWAPQSLSVIQLQFIAEKFDSIIISGGDAGLTKASALKSYNPEINILGYINSTELLIDSPRYKECDPIEAFFAHDENDNRVRKKDGVHLLANIYNQQWSEKMTQWINELPPEIDVFLDNSVPILYVFFYDILPEGYNPSKYAQGMSGLMGSIRQNTNRVVIMNGLHEGFKYSGTYTANVDGGVIEGFIFNPYYQNVRYDFVSWHVGTLIQAALNGKLVVASVESYKENIQNRIFGLACYFLGASQYSTYNFMDISYQSLSDPQFYPEYGIQLGAPINSPGTFEDLFESELLVRHYADGVVMVNPWDYDITLSDTDKYLKVTPHGGGLVGTDGVADGYLTYERLSARTTLSKESALILKYYADEDGSSDAAEDGGLHPVAASGDGGRCFITFAAYVF